MPGFYSCQNTIQFKCLWWDSIFSCGWKGYTINGITFSCPSAEGQHHVGMGIWVTSRPSAVILAHCLSSSDTGKSTEKILYLWLFYIIVVVGNREQIYIHATYVTAYGKNEILFRCNDFCMFLTFIAFTDHSSLNSHVSFWEHTWFISYTISWI